MITNEVIFYILLGSLFVLFFLPTNYLYNNTQSNLKKLIILGVVSIIYTLVFVGYSTVTNLFRENFNYCPSPEAKLCRGGPYMWQGNSERAKFCRNLAKTAKGRAQIGRYECGPGFSGMPGCGFTFTPDSNSGWRNERCDTQRSCDISNNGIF